MILDCQDIDSTYASIRAITGLERASLDAFFTSFNLESSIDLKTNQYLEPIQIFQNAVERFSKIQMQAMPFQATTYFHLTRSLNPDRLATGLQPLHSIINDLWADLYALISSEISLAEWSDLRRILETDNSLPAASDYQHKLTGVVNAGPFGFLIRDVIYWLEACGQYDYFDCPEIIAPICTICFQKTGINLKERFKNASVPCVVKFRTSAAQSSSLVTALYYLYCMHRGDTFSMELFESFDGRGRAISSSDIVAVCKYMDDLTRRHCG